MNIYDFTVKDQSGNNVSLDTYRGKVLLVVNTATECGFTPQYNALQKFYAENADKGFEVLDFPCNQFLEQAPGTDVEIHAGCVRRFKITFPQFSKIEVNGENAIPLYKWFTSSTSFAGFDDSCEITPILKDVLSKINPEYASTSDIKWNFTKFLISRDGEIIKRFEPTADMDEMFKTVKEYL